MGRLCERPGCSEDAAVAYGMRIEDLVFWLDALTDASAADGGVLCQRHGDSMVVPRDWTLDDLRDPDLHLFRPPVRPDRPATMARRRRSEIVGSDAEQLALAGFVVPGPDSDHDPHPDGGPGLDGPTDVRSGEPLTPDTGTENRPIGDQRAEDRTDDPASESPWTPSFDTADDLDGLLAARGPLLSRAFRGTDRPA